MLPKTYTCRFIARHCIATCKAIYGKLPSHVPSLGTRRAWKHSCCWPRRRASSVTARCCATATVCCRWQAAPQACLCWLLRAAGPSSQPLLQSKSPRRCPCARTWRAGQHAQRPFCPATAPRHALSAPSEVVVKIIGLLKEVSKALVWLLQAPASLQQLCSAARAHRQDPHPAAEVAQASSSSQSFCKETCLPVWPGEHAKSSGGLAAEGCTVQNFSEDCWEWGVLGWAPRLSPRTRYVLSCACGQH